MIELVQSHGVVILAALLAISEALALIPAVKANGVFDAIVKGMRAIYTWLSHKS